MKFIGLYFLCEKNNTSGEIHKIFIFFSFFRAAEPMTLAEEEEEKNDNLWTNTSTFLNR